MGWLCKKVSLLMTYNVKINANSKCKTHAAAHSRVQSQMNMIVLIESPLLWQEHIR